MSTVAKPNYMKIEDYSLKSFVLRGDTKQYKDEIKSLKGKWNPKLKGGAGWIFSYKQLDTVKSWIQDKVNITPEEIKRDLEAIRKCLLSVTQSPTPTPSLSTSRKSFVMPECDCEEENCTDCYGSRKELLKELRKLTGEKKLKTKKLSLLALYEKCEEIKEVNNFRLSNRVGTLNALHMFTGKSLLKGIPTERLEEILKEFEKAEPMSYIELRDKKESYEIDSLRIKVD